MVKRALVVEPTSHPDNPNGETRPFWASPLSAPPEAAPGDDARVHRGAPTLRARASKRTPPEDPPGRGEVADLVAARESAIARLPPHGPHRSRPTGVGRAEAEVAAHPRLTRGTTAGNRPDFEHRNTPSSVRGPRTSSTKERGAQARRASDQRSVDLTGCTTARLSLDGTAHPHGRGRSPRHATGFPEGTYDPGRDFDARQPQP